MIRLCNPIQRFIWILVLVGSSLTTVASAQSSNGVYAIIKHTSVDSSDKVQLVANLNDITNVRVGFDSIRYQPQLSITWNEAAAARSFLISQLSNNWFIRYNDSVMVIDTFSTSKVGAVWHISNQYTYEEANRKAAFLKPFVQAPLKLGKQSKQVTKQWEAMMESWNSGVAQPWLPYSDSTLNIFANLEGSAVMIKTAVPGLFSVNNIKRLPSVYCNFSKDKKSVHLTEYWICDMVVKDRTYASAYIQVLADWRKVGKDWKMVKLYINRHL